MPLRDVGAAQGYIEPTPGRATDKRQCRLPSRLSYARASRPRLSLSTVGASPNSERILNEEGITLPPFRQFGQGYKSMSPAMRAFEERVLNRRLIHSANPLLTWAVSNVAIERDAAGNVKPSKERSRERIDPAVAAIMAVGLAAAQAPTLIFEVPESLGFSVLAPRATPVLLRAVLFSRFVL